MHLASLQLGRQPGEGFHPEHVEEHASDIRVMRAVQKLRDYIVFEGVVPLDESLEPIAV